MKRVDLKNIDEEVTQEGNVFVLTLLKSITKGSWYVDNRAIYANLQSAISDGESHVSKFEFSNFYIEYTKILD